MATTTWREPARDLPVIGSPDVLVVGAGSAGIAAAVAAGRRGASVWLVEKGQWVGGLATLGLVNLLLTLDDGAGTQVVAGLCQEVVDRLASRGAAAAPPRADWDSEDPAVVAPWREWGLVWGATPEAVRYAVAFDPDAFIDVAYEALVACNVRIRLHTLCTAVHRGDGERIEAVVVESKAGREAIRPGVVVDTTGDADCAAAAGLPHDRVSIPPNLWFRVGGVADTAGLGRVAFRTTGTGRVLVPWGPHPDRVDACDPDDMTRAELACRAGARAHFEALKATDPAFAGAWVDDYAHMLGITESRRLVGDHVLAKEEAGTAFADAIARTGHWTRRGMVFDIPYRCLKAAAVPNLLVAGRCISTTRYVHQATKEIPAAMATGEAAGAAAVHALERAGDVHAVDVAAVRRDLAGAGAIVGG